MKRFFKKPLNTVWAVMTVLVGMYVTYKTRNMLYGLGITVFSLISNILGYIEALND